MTDFETLSKLFAPWRPRIIEASIGKLIVLEATCISGVDRYFITYHFDERGSLIEVTVK